MDSLGAAGEPNLTPVISAAAVICMGSRISSRLEFYSKRVCLTTFGLLLIVVIEGRGVFFGNMQILISGCREASRIYRLFLASTLHFQDVL